MPTNSHSCETNKLSYKIRIEYLRYQAKEDDIIVNENSISDFNEFIKTSPFNRRASLVLTISGNIRANWKWKDDKYIAIQFVGEGIGSYVVRKKTVFYGTLTLSEIRKNLLNWMFEVEIEARHDKEN